MEHAVYDSAASTSCLMNNVRLLFPFYQNSGCVGAVNVEDIDNADVDFIPLNHVRTSKPRYTNTAQYVSLISMILILPLEFLLLGKGENAVKDLLLGQKNKKK